MYVFWDFLIPWDLYQIVEMFNFKIADRLYIFIIYTKFINVKHKHTIYFWKKGKNTFCQ